MRLALFDFDGTVTCKDTLIDFLFFAKGRIKSMLGIIVLLPIIIGYSLKLVSHVQLKKAIFTVYLKKWNAANYRQIAMQYSKDLLPGLIKKSALEKILWHQSRGDQVVIVSASIEDWLIAWCDEHKLDLIAGRVEIKSGYLTGKLIQEDCYGIEKVHRINAAIDLGKYDYIYAYGDSEGDKEMLELANEKYFRYFIN